MRDFTRDLVRASYDEILSMKMSGKKMSTSGRIATRSMTAMTMKTQIMSMMSRVELWRRA